MDETQKRKINAKEFLMEHKKVGFIVGIIFLSLFVIYIALVVFYSSLNDMSAESQFQNTGVIAPEQESFVDRLFPEFREDSKEVLDENGLPVFGTSTNPFVNVINGIAENIGIGGAVGEDAGVDAIEIEKDPVAGYVVFDKPTSIKKYIKNKPSLCLEKISVVNKKDEKSKAVENFQNTLKSIEGFGELEVTGVLDEKTREQIYIFQKRYSEILYKEKTNKEPTRLIDKETTHFINLLCSFDKEEKNDFINIPTLRYAKKSTREITDYNTQTKEKIPLNNRLATGTEEAVFSSDGKYVIFRSEGNSNLSGTGLGSRAKKGEIVTEFINLENQNRQTLEKNITTLDFNKQGQVVYGVPENVSMSIKIYDPARQEVRRVATIPMREWNLFWLGDGTSGEIGIYNKPSAFADGILMTLNINTKKIERKTTPQAGFAAVKTNFTDFSIGSIGRDGDIRTVLINNKTKIIGDLGLRTFAEKCANTVVFDGVFCAVPKNISGSVVYPDDWYKQKYFSEDVLVYKTVAGTTTKIISTFDNRPFSVIKLQVHQNGIFFIEERSLSLYSVEG
jgi:hypothetical protein